DGIRDFHVTGVQTCALPIFKQKVALILLPAIAFLVITPFATYAYYSKDIADQERLMNRNNTGVVLLDKDGEVFYSTGKAGKRVRSEERRVGEEGRSLRSRRR